MRRSNLLRDAQRFCEALESSERRRKFLCAAEKLCARRKAPRYPPLLQSAAKRRDPLAGSAGILSASYPKLNLPAPKSVSFSRLGREGDLSALRRLRVHPRSENRPGVLPCAGVLDHGRADPSGPHLLRRADDPLRIHRLLLGDRRHLPPALGLPGRRRWIGKPGDDLPRNAPPAGSGAALRDGPAGRRTLL